MPEVPSFVVRGCSARIMAKAMNEVAVEDRIVARERLPYE